MAAARQDTTPGSIADPPSSVEQDVGRGEVAIRVEQFGAGDCVREGDWAGIRLALKDSSDAPREVAVQLRLPDADGDSALYTRFVTLNPGVEVGVWLYAPMSWELRAGGALRVSISSAVAGERGLVAGEQVAWAPIPARRVVRSDEPMIAAVGSSALGLEQFGQTFREREDNPGSHELIQSVIGLTPASIPDSWLGLAPFEVVVWSEGDPAQLQGTGPTQAIREWVNRGGHLIVSLPAVGQTWSAPSNPLADLMPSARIERLIDADLNVYARWLTGADDRPLPKKAVIHRFAVAADTDARDATPVVTGPHGCVAVRRLVGAGMVTLLGLDLNSRALSRGQSLRADSFWPRITGRRAAAMSVGEMETYANSAKSSWSRTPPPVVWPDQTIGRSISKGRVASVGVLLALVVFAAYWVAGPVSVFLLKRRGLEKHSWLVFIAISGVFTVAAWMGASALRPRREEAWHFTILDHVYAQPVQRARVFSSVLLPRYGEQRVTLGEPGVDQAWSQALVPWHDPASETALRFPDARGYLADVRALTDLVVPARSTIKTFRAEWLGGPRWTMPGPTDQSSAPRLDSTGRLVGKLVHRMPAALSELRIILVKGQVSDTSAMVRRDVFTPRPLIADAYAWKLSKPWEPDAVLDLAAAGLEPSDAALASNMLRDLVPSTIRRLDRLGSDVLDSLDESDIDALLCFNGSIEPPDPTKVATLVEKMPSAVRRQVTHGCDISAWFTQPCLILIGRVEGRASPVPFAVDGQALDGKARPASGRTIVRWVYPLSPRPHVVGATGGVAPASGVAGS